MPNAIPTISRSLLGDVRGMILAARQEVARAVDTGLVTLYRHIGQRVRRDILQQKRAEYGERFVSALRRQSTWTHFKMLAYVEDDLKRDFYAEMCRIERWNTRTLTEKIRSMLPQTAGSLCCFTQRPSG